MTAGLSPAPESAPPLQRHRCRRVPTPRSASHTFLTHPASGRTRDRGRVHVTPRHPSPSFPLVTFSSLLGSPPSHALPFASYGLRLHAMPPALQIAAAATSVLGVALGVRLLVVLARSSALKPLAAATSAAAAALRTPRALATASSPVAALLAASKAATKSYKAARTLDPASRLPSLPSSKRLKAAFAAASLLRLATAAPIPAASPAGVAVLAVLNSGYKLSKNTYKITEGFLGLHVHKGLRNGIDALGVVVKVAVIASEVAVWVGSLCWGHGRGRCVRFLGFTRPTSLVLLGCTKSEPQVVVLEPGILELDGEGYQLEERAGSELLSLAVPVPQH